MDNKVWAPISSDTLVYGGSWKESEYSIRAMLFSRMLDLAEGRIKHYSSDLFHDALWLERNITGPMGFDWIARESGTFIGDICLDITDSDWEDVARYRFEIREEGQRWMLDIYQSVPLEEINNDPGCDLCGMHDRSEPCSLTQVEGDWREEIPGTGVNYYGNPTLRNEETLRKENGMESYLEELHTKLASAQDTLGTAHSRLEELEEFVTNLETYVEELESYINELESEPDFQGEVSLEVYFNSED